MPKYHELVYLDTSVIIAWLKNELRAQVEMEGYRYCFERIERGEIKAITSVISKTEILNGNSSPDKDRALRGLFVQRRSFEFIDFDIRIADRSRIIRSYFHSTAKKLETPDAVHLATAVHYNVDAFYTFDEDDLLPLSGNVAGHPLVICKPPAPIQGKLFFPS